ncbi:TIGR03905 family TSCPD domain-containing protein [Halanaerobaculum tunisiense]
MKKTFKPDGVCAQEIKFEVNDSGIIEEVEFIGGCSGNSTGIAALVEGAKVEEVAARLEGITCRNQTSCPDQLSQALQEVF